MQHPVDYFVKHMIPFLLEKAFEAAVPTRCVCAGCRRLVDHAAPYKIQGKANHMLCPPCFALTIRDPVLGVKRQKNTLYFSLTNMEGIGAQVTDKDCRLLLWRQNTGGYGALGRVLTDEYPIRVDKVDNPIQWKRNLLLNPPAERFIFIERFGNDHLALIRRMVFSTQHRVRFVNPDGDIAHTQPIDAGQFRAMDAWFKTYPTLPPRMRLLVRALLTWRIHHAETKAVIAGRMAKQASEWAAKLRKLEDSLPSESRQGFYRFRQALAYMSVWHRQADLRQLAWHREVMAWVESNLEAAARLGLALPEDPATAGAVARLMSDDLKGLVKLTTAEL